PRFGGGPLRHDLVDRGVGFVGGARVVVDRRQPDVRGGASLLIAVHAREHAPRVVAAARREIVVGQRDGRFPFVAGRRGGGLQIWFGGVRAPGRDVEAGERAVGRLVGRIQLHRREIFA